MANGRAGRGTKTFEGEEAQRLVEELNREYPQIHHEAVETGEGGAMTGKPSWESSTEELELAGAR